METFTLYAIASIFLLIPSVSYAVITLFFESKLKHFHKIRKGIVFGTTILTIFFVMVTVWHAKFALLAVNGDTNGTLKPGVGLIDLIGVPYGGNRVANFFAWLSTALLYPAALITLLIPFFPSKTGKLAAKYFGLPISFFEFVFLFNLCNSINGDCSLNFRNIFLAIQTGLIFATTIIVAMDNRVDTLFPKPREIVHFVGLFAVAFLATLPPSTFANLMTTDGILFGTFQTSLRIYDFSFLHRLSIYYTIFLIFVIYFLFRNASLNLRRSALIIISVGCLISFMHHYNELGLFSYNEAGQLEIDVNAIPLHLCHTALFVVPLCAAFNLKRLFYFTYFINVFGAACAILMPNVGENLNIYSPDVVIYWYNHWAAFSTPLLAVALKIFDRPKFKQMLWSLLFFFFYYLVIVFSNAWLSNYVKGYNPDIPGSGTDYFFINSDFIASKILNDRDSNNLLNVTFTWTWGDNIFLIRPLYQSIYFSVYIAISFAMWFVYSLFFKIADSHIELRNMLIVARKENISMKERKQMEALNEQEKNPSEISLVFENFSKRYGNSPVLSARGVNLKVTGGKIYGFLGPNGAGKSTCIKSAIGIQPVTSGHIFVCGHDTTTESVKSKSLVGYVPDHYALYEKLTGREYINYIADLYHVTKEDRDERIAKFIDLFELNQAFDNRMQTYSHGMKQKITIIAALVHDPKVWILDEPLTGLDPQSIFQVKQCMIEHAKKGNIVFFSSHIIDVVEKLCTDIAIIKKGQIIYQASMEQVEKDHSEGLEAFYLDMIHDNGDLDE